MHAASPHPSAYIAGASQARQEIVAHDPKNEAALERIQSAIIIVSLDSTKPYTREEKSWGLWVGDGKDRWFDKHQRTWILGERSLVRSVG